MDTNVVLHEGEIQCPSCQVVVYKKFVRENGKCPACHKQAGIVDGQMEMTPLPPPPGQPYMFS